jgi:hypothetical protein
LLPDRSIEPEPLPDQGYRFRCGLSAGHPLRNVVRSDEEQEEDRHSHQPQDQQALEDSSRQEAEHNTFLLTEVAATRP